MLPKWRIQASRTVLSGSLEALYPKQTSDMNLGECLDYVCNCSYSGRRKSVLLGHKFIQSYGVTVKVKLSHSEALKVLFLNLFTDQKREIQKTKLACSNSWKEIPVCTFFCWVLFPFNSETLQISFYGLENQAFQQSMNGQAISVLYYKINQETGMKQNFKYNTKYQWFASFSELFLIQLY